MISLTYATNVIMITAVIKKDLTDVDIVYESDDGKNDHAYTGLKSINLSKVASALSR
jgi:hypothetical protein